MNNAAVNTKSKYSIAYLIPYFGKLPASFQLWLLSCKMNPSVDWILLTDDKTEYDYPENIHVYYMSYEEIKDRIASHFDFPVVINKPWRLCEYRPAYGEIFAKELKGYDFWGHCDMDLIWGDIRKFITDDILERYDKIGFQGHSTLYRNNDETNARYKTIIDGIPSYKDSFQSEEGMNFDEVGICRIYDAMGVEYYKETNFAHLDLFSNSFHLGHLPNEEEYKNNRQIIVWRKGKIFRYYIHNGRMHIEDEFMYLHTFMRPVTYKIDIYDENEIYICYPDIVRRAKESELTYGFIQKYGTCSALKFYIRVAVKYRHKLTVKKIVKNLIKKIKWAIFGRKQNE